MTSSSASSSPEPDLDRLKSDLDTIHSAIGRGLPFGRADIRFMWLGAVSILIFAIGHHFGAREGLARILFALPLILMMAGYLLFMAIRKRTANPQRANEYRLTLIGLGMVVVIFGPVMWWARDLGIPSRTFGAVIVVLFGILTIAGSLFWPIITSRAYRRISSFFAGVMLTAIGVTIPAVTPDRHGMILGIWGLLVFVGAGLIMQYFLKREVESVPESE